MKIEDVWKMCCALHNWLLDIDGISAFYENGVHIFLSDWEGSLGDLDFDGVREGILERGEDIMGKEMLSSERSNRLLRSSVSNLSLAESGRD